mmetsp:Transcript_13578/g.29140  ORF Transcript_13578/g.29140 Transcript_13578/m.29140 type:complete len:567 (-) Transcript_13578:67-1767(-)
MLITEEFLSRGSILSTHSTSSQNNNRRRGQFIRQMSKLVADPIELDLDERRLHNAVREAGESSFGIDAISVWMFDEELGRLVHLDGGWWRSENMEVGNAHALARLEDDTRDDYTPPNSVCPGTDIVGILWAESSGKNNVPLQSHDKAEKGTSPTNRTSSNSQSVRWRDISSITQDPDTANSTRVNLLDEAGFAMAAGITFKYMHNTGIVVFFTTHTLGDEQDDHHLTGVTNCAYLYNAAQYIGTTISLAETRRASLAEQFKLTDKCFDMSDHGHLTQNYSMSVEDGLRGRAKKDQTRAHDNIPKKIQVALEKTHRAGVICNPAPLISWAHKLKGGGMQIPPSMSWSQSAWTVFGSFFGLLTLSALNEYYRLLSNDDYFLLLGPFGALATLMYGLSSAPASQPRNAIISQTVTGALSLAFTYVPETVLPVWVRTALAPAFAIGCMTKLGVVHPPAGATSILYASGKYNFAFYALVVLSTVISVIPATIINNMSSKRQYPIYWGFGDFFSWKCRSEWSAAAKGIGMKSTMPEEDDESSRGSMRSDRKGKPNVIHEVDNEDEEDEESSK